MTSYYIFWRIGLYFMRLYTWTVNIVITCYFISWRSNYGLQALWSYDLYTDYDINSKTGVISETDPAPYTYPKSLSRLKNWIQESRDEFEARPDESIFGKDSERIVNYIENYVIRLLIWGTILFVLYPIVILVVSLLGLVVALTSIVWAFISLNIFTIFCICIYDVDSTNNGSTCLPLVRIVIDFFTRFVLQFVFAILGLILQPLLSVFFLVFSFVFFVISYICITFTYYLTKILAKIPKFDTFVAWKIGGPGVSTRFYNQISIEDALMMISLELEYIELNQRKTELNKLLNQPIETRQNSIDNIFESANMSFNIENVVQDSIYKYSNLLEDQIQNRINLILPRKIDGVKFDTQELDLLMKVGIELIMDLAKTKKFESYIWEYNSLPKDAWSRLLEQLIRNAFGNEALESLNDLDFRVLAKKESDDMNEFEMIKKKVLKNYNIEKRILSIVKSKVEIKTIREVSMDEVYLSNKCFYFEYDHLRQKEELKRTKSNDDDDARNSHFLLK